MKTRQALLSIVVLGASLVLLTGPGVAAPPLQTPEPPGEPLATSNGSPDEEYPFDVEKVVKRSVATLLSPSASTIDIAVTSNYETTPAVALCASDQYLVVYEQGGEIYGQRLTNSGALLGNAFAISSGAYTEANPDVACEWAYNRFIVVWDYDFGGTGTDFDVRAQGVYGGHQSSGSQLYGSMLNVGYETGPDERDPAIACNSYDHTCLVVYENNETGSGDVYGQRVAVGSSDISRQGDRFNVSDYSSAEYNPDVAWGGNDDNYLVAWQYMHTTPSTHYRIVYSHVYDTDQGAGDERQHSGTWLINVGERDNHQTVPAVAYNRDTQKYLVAFQYDYYGDGSDYDVLARRVYGTGQVIQGDAFFVAGTGDDELSPGVAFSGGPESYSGGMGFDQFLVPYVYNGDMRGLYAQAVKGTYASSGGQLDGSTQELHTTFAASGFGEWLPNVTGSINNGRYMVVWQYDTGGTVWDKDILGTMLSPGSAIYLPLVVNNHSSSFDFQPNPDGYSFANYGNSHYWQDDLGVADLINMFGAAQVCASGSTPGDCVLTASADEWRDDMLDLASGGHCEGMAVTSLRFFKGQTYYTGDTTPGDFQTGAQRVYDLTRPNQAIDNYIMYYFALQDVEEVWYPTGLIRINNTPKQILELIRQELDSGGNDPYSMGIYDTGFTVGHAITPYGIVDKGGGTYWLYVYDNNYPGQARYIVFDTNADTWYYTSTYHGTASTHNLDLTRISYRNMEYFTPPFSVTSTAVEFFLTGGGEMLITNGAGQRIGYDAETGQLVNEIPDGQIIPLRGAPGPMYRLPLQEADQLYNVTVSGQTIDREVSTKLVMVGPGYVVGFEDIQLQPGQNLFMSLSGDGHQLIFEEGQAAPAPQVFMAIDDIEP